MRVSFQELGGGGVGEWVGGGGKVTHIFVTSV